MRDHKLGITNEPPKENHSRTHVDVLGVRYPSKVLAFLQESNTRAFHSAAALRLGNKLSELCNAHRLCQHLTGTKKKVKGFVAVEKALFLVFFVVFSGFWWLLRAFLLAFCWLFQLLGDLQGTKGEGTSLKAQRNHHEELIRWGTTKLLTRKHRSYE